MHAVATVVEVSEILLWPGGIAVQLLLLLLEHPKSNQFKYHAFLSQFNRDDHDEEHRSIDQPTIPRLPLEVVWAQAA